MPSIPLRRLAIFGVVALGLAGAGCGGDDEALEEANRRADTAEEHARRLELQRAEERAARAEKVARAANRRARSAERLAQAGARQATGPEAAPAQPLSFEGYVSEEGGYSTVVPSGWSLDTRTSSDGSDLLHRATFTASDGTTLLIDSTPTTPPTAPDGVTTSQTLPHPTFGSVREYVFSGGSLPQCSASCVVYQIDDGQGGGYAVLGGGGNHDTARVVAEKAALSLAYYDY